MSDNLRGRTKELCKVDEGERAGVWVVATGDPDSEAPAERSKTLAPCSEGADALNSGVSGEGAQDITDHYPNPKGAKRWATKLSPAQRLAQSRDDIINIGKLLDEKFDGSVALIPVGDKQVRILNFGDAKDQRAFHKAVDQVLQFDNINNAATFRVFGSDGDLVFNNWKEKPNGEDYVSRISSAGRPDVLEYLSDFLAPKVEAVDRKFAGQYNLKTNEGLEKYLSGLGKNLERKAQGGVVQFAKGGSVFG